MDTEIKINPKNWGEMQRACHRLLNECFEDKKQAYTWLSEKFGRGFSFHKLNHKTDIKLLHEVHSTLLILSLKP